MKRPTPGGTVLGLLCLMYLTTYVDRVNIATAATAIRSELGLTNFQLGIVFSAFAYPGSPRSSRRRYSSPASAAISWAARSATASCTGRET